MSANAANAAINRAANGASPPSSASKPVKSAWQRVKNAAKTLRNKFMGRNKKGNSRFTRYGRMIKGRLGGLGTTLRRFGSRLRNRYRNDTPSTAGLFGNNNAEFENRKRHSMRRSTRRSSRR